MTEPPVEHDCQASIVAYLDSYWYTKYTKYQVTLPPHVGALIKCDCQALFQLQPDGTWLEGEWNWEVPFSGRVYCSLVSA